VKPPHTTSNRGPPGFGGNIAKRPQSMDVCLSKQGVLGVSLRCREHGIFVAHRDSMPSAANYLRTHTYGCVHAPNVELSHSTDLWLAGRRMTESHTNRIVSARRSQVNRSPGGFTLMELMVVVIIISVFAAMALPSMLQGRHERRAFGAAADISAIIREARTRAIGRGAAQLVTLKFGNGGVTRGTFAHFENADPGTREPQADGCKLAEWNTAAASSGSVRISAFSLDGGVDVNAQLETSQLIGGAKSIADLHLCFAPSGRVYAANGSLAALRSSNGMPEPITIQIERTGGGGMLRSVVVLPSGATRIVTK
jgi:prepilin-type N-terminal cleavage/methylation domain-containing protein